MKVSTSIPTAEVYPAQIPFPFCLPTTATSLVYHPTTPSPFFRLAETSNTPLVSFCLHTPTQSWDLMIPQYFASSCVNLINLVSFLSSPTLPPSLCPGDTFYSCAASWILPGANFIAGLRVLGSTTVTLFACPETDHWIKAKRIDCHHPQLVECFFF